MTKPVLPFLETMITQVCNLSCLGCSNYSDLSLKGYVKWNDGKSQLKEWLKVIEVPDFGIMGGEPLINPEVNQWIYGVRELMPKSQIRFTTNGLLLHKQLDIIDYIHDIGNIVFKITVHKETDQLQDIIDNMFINYNWRPVTEFGINRWKTANNVRLQITKPTTFLKTYKNDYKSMKPHHSDPKGAFSSCIQKECALLYKGKIFKCSTAGLLKDALEYNDIEPNEWDRYIDNGISPADDVTEFIENFGKPHTLCGQCPDNNETINHLTTVTYK